MLLLQTRVALQREHRRVREAPRDGQGKGATAAPVLDEAEVAVLVLRRLPLELPPEDGGERPLRTAPCYDRLKNHGAVFGQKFGWERANWFAPDGVPQEDHWSFRRSNWFEHVGNEVRNVAENAGVLDMSAFAKIGVMAQ